MRKRQDATKSKIKCVSIYLTERYYKKLKGIADAEERSLAKMGSIFIKNGIISYDGEALGEDEVDEEDNT
jgi:hypothetical protein